MAKELPYFKFECNQWDSGNIQMCSMEAQGLFINLCSLYWSRVGELPVKLALQKLCKSYASAYDELMHEDIITEENDMIIIAFLDEQLNEFADTSQKRRDAANKRWSNASALQVQSKSNAIREEKRREEKKREDKKEVPAPEEFLSYCKEVLKEKYEPLEFALKAKFDSWIEDNWKDGNKKPIKNWKTKIKNTIPYLKPMGGGSSFKSNDKYPEHLKTKSFNDLEDAM